jgi:mRNA interferase MazF
MKRGEVYDARLDRSKDLSSADHGPSWLSVANAINESSPIVSAAPCTTYREGRRIYPSQVLVKAPEVGLDADSVILGEQVRVLDKEAAATPTWGADARDNGATQ